MDIRLPRKSTSEIQLRDGDFTYRLIPDFCQIPALYTDNCAQLPSVACADNGQIYCFFRHQNNPVAIFNQNGTYQRSFGADLFRHPHSLTVTRAGTLWCADDLAHVVKHLSAQGEVLQVLGNGIPSDSGFDGECPWPACQDTIRQAAPPFNRPVKVAEASNGDLFIADGYSNASIHHFSADGKLIRTWGTPGTHPGEFRLPHCVYVDAKDQVWVTDRENYRTHVFDTSGQLLSSFSNMLWPSEVCGCGDLIYISENRGALAVFNTDLQLVARLGYDGFNALHGHGIGCDRQGNIFLAELQNCRVTKLERI